MSMSKAHDVVFAARADKTPSCLAQSMGGFSGFA